MKNWLLILFILISINTYAQIDTTSWINTLDTNSTNIFKKKKYIPTIYYKEIDIHSIHEIANPNQKWNGSHVRRIGIPNKKLNWLAQDKNGNTFISVSMGDGFLIYTYCLVLNTEKNIKITYTGITQTNDFREFFLSLKSGLLRIDI